MAASRSLPRPTRRSSTTWANPPSPLTRARQSAAILSRAIGAECDTRVSEDLRPSGRPNRVVDLLQAEFLDDPGDVVIVAHEPVAGRREHRAGLLQRRLRIEAVVRPSARVLRHLVDVAPQRERPRQRELVHEAVRRRVRILGPQRAPQAAPREDHAVERVQILPV